jgi:uncharacterized protein (UPF0335 family)
MNDSTVDTYSITSEELQQIIEQVETLNVEKAQVNNQIKEVMSGAKGRGYDTKTIRKIISLRKKPKNAIQEEEAMLDLYKSVLGMDQ